MIYCTEKFPFSFPEEIKSSSELLWKESTKELQISGYKKICDMNMIAKPAFHIDHFMSFY